VRCFASCPLEAALVVPLAIKNRLVGVLYTQGERALLKEKLDRIHRIACTATMTFKKSILRGKILMNEN